ncbi:hypothetical protein IP88_07115 [alpha proteobacterium AAP81b]|nr:hypothetical protein IP88_07115 [alpha proteobacterium AAP81b]
MGHDFADLGLLDRALTHASVKGAPNYQRLEFLGDRVLGCVVAAWLHATHDEPEGRLNRRFHALVEGVANARVARAWGVPDIARLEPMARHKGLHESDNVLGDIAEAVVAAVFLDGGWDAADAFVRRHWSALLADGPRFLADPKSRLQEWSLDRRLGTPRYLVIDRRGPDHAPHFTVEVSVPGHDAAQGEGNNKQEAEKAAAVALLARVTA